MKLSKIFWSFAYLSIWLFVYLAIIPPSPAFASCRIAASCGTDGIETSYFLSPDEAYPRADCTNPSAAAGNYNLCCENDTPEEVATNNYRFSARENASSTFALKSPICKSANETIPTCASCFNGSMWICSGSQFGSGQTDSALKGFNGSVDPDADGDGKFWFNGREYDSRSTFVCQSNTPACGNPDADQCVGTFDYPQPTPPPPPPSCDQVRSDEPHPLRPNPGAPCVDKPDPAGRLSCASDFEMHHVIDDPYGWGAFSCPPGDLGGFTDKSNEKPYGVSVDVTESPLLDDRDRPVMFNGQPVKKYACAYEYSRVLQDIEFTPQIDHTLLDLPIAGLASRNCEGSSPGAGCLADAQPAAALLSNYTSWYHQGVVDPPEPQETISNQLAEALANYMNSLIDKKTEGDIPGNVKLLSPAFNISNAATPPLFTAMEAAGADFGGLDGFAGNTYTLEAGGLKTAYFWYTEFLQGKVKQYGKPMIFTEFGDFRTATQPKGNRPGLIAEMKAEFDRVQRDGDIKAILYFAAIDSNLSNPSFTIHRLSDAELAQVISPNRTKSGASSGLPVAGNGAYADGVKTRNLKWSMEIAYSRGDSDAVIKAFNRALDQGLTPVLRICAGSSCDFSDPQVYAQFLKTVAAGLNGRTFWAIAGPNEPEREQWVLADPSLDLTPGQPDWITLLGPIRKLIPKEVLDARKNDVIDWALLPAGNPKKTYNQIVGFVKGGRAVPRSQAIKARDFDQVVRLSDMANHRAPGPDDQPWREIWENYMPLTSTSDLPGRVFITIGSSETSEFKAPQLIINNPNYKVSFPHNRELDEASSLLQSIFKPLELAETTDFKETRVSPDYYDVLNLAASYTTVRGKTVTGKAAPRPAFDTQACNLIAKTNSGDRLHDEKSPPKDNTIKGTLFVTKPVVFNGTLYSTNYGTASKPARGESVGTIGVYIQNPPAADSAWDRLINGPASVFKAMIPPGLAEDSDIPAQSKGLGYYCGPDCRVNPTSPSAFFLHWGSVLELFHTGIQKMLNPL